MASDEAPPWVLTHQSTSLKVSLSERKVRGVTVMEFRCEQKASYVPFNFKGVVEGVDVRVGGEWVRSVGYSVLNPPKGNIDPVSQEAMQLYRLRQHEVIVVLEEHQRLEKVALRVKHTARNPPGCVITPTLLLLTSRPEFSRVWLPTLDNMQARPVMNITLDTPHATHVLPPQVPHPPSLITVIASDFKVTQSERFSVFSPHQPCPDGIYDVISEAFASTTVALSHPIPFPLSIVFADTSDVTRSCGVILLPQAWLRKDALHLPMLFYEMCCSIAFQYFHFQVHPVTSEDSWLTCGLSGAVAWYCMLQWSGVNNTVDMLAREGVAVRNELRRYDVPLHAEKTVVDPENTAAGSPVLFRKSVLAVLQLIAMVVRVRRGDRCDASAWLPGVKKIVAGIPQGALSAAEYMASLPAGQRDIQDFQKHCLQPYGVPAVKVCAEYNLQTQSLVLAVSKDGARGYHGAVDVLVALQNESRGEITSMGEAMASIVTRTHEVQVPEGESGTVWSTHLAKCDTFKPLAVFDLQDALPYQDAEERDPIHYIRADPYQKLLLVDLQAVQKPYKHFIQVHHDMTIPGKVVALTCIGRSGMLLKAEQFLNSIVSDSRHHHSVRGAALKGLSKYGKNPCDEILRQADTDLPALLLQVAAAECLGKVAFPTQGMADALVAAAKKDREGFTYATKMLAVLGSMGMQEDYREVVLGVLKGVLPQSWRTPYEVAACLEALAMLDEEVPRIEEFAESSCKCVAEVAVRAMVVKETYSVLDTCTSIPKMLPGVPKAAIVRCMSERKDARDVFNSLLHCYCSAYGEEQVTVFPWKPMDKEMFPGRLTKIFNERANQACKRLEVKHQPVAVKRRRVVPTATGPNINMVLKIPAGEVGAVHAHLNSMEKMRNCVPLLEMVYKTQNPQLERSLTLQVVPQMSEMLASAVDDPLTEKYKKLMLVKTNQFGKCCFWYLGQLGVKGGVERLKGDLTRNITAGGVKWWYDVGYKDSGIIVSYEGKETALPCMDVGRVVDGNCRMLGTPGEVGLRRCRRLWLRVGEHGGVLPYSLDMFPSKYGKQLFEVMPPYVSPVISFAVEGNLLVLTLTKITLRLTPTATVLPPYHVAVAVVAGRSSILVSMSASPIALPYPASIAGMVLQPLALATPPRAVSIGRRLVRCTIKPVSRRGVVLCLEVLSNAAGDAFLKLLPLYSKGSVTRTRILLPDTWRVPRLREGPVKWCCGVLFVDSHGTLQLASAPSTAPPKGTFVARPTSIKYEGTAQYLPGGKMDSVISETVAGLEVAQLSFTTLF
eukprot:TRINITY_DN34126_c0_g1_i1.p1 TRINITY_DN34126_c0_g1~~TRINITY_DN34126_c0_g1_i1.p1  ORF type:complete len:1316 (+),score=313.46 TRINITY_DN34126_c0_g1_i1:94-3948(+)